MMYILSGKLNLLRFSISETIAEQNEIWSGMIVTMIHYLLIFGVIISSWYCLWLKPEYQIIQPLHLAQAGLSIFPCLHPDPPQTYHLLILADSIRIFPFYLMNSLRSTAQSWSYQWLLIPGITCKCFLSIVKERRITKPLLTECLKCIWYKVPLR